MIIQNSATQISEILAAGDIFMFIIGLLNWEWSFGDFIPLWAQSFPG